MMRLAAVLLAALAQGLAAGCAEPERAPDVLVVVLDTVRIDRTSVFDPSRDTMPFLAEFAKRSAVFSNAWATSSRDIRLKTADKSATRSSWGN